MTKTSNNIATIEEVIEELEKQNLEYLIQNLVQYASFIMKGDSIIEAEKLVEDLFEKVIAGVRNWNKSYKFKQFLFGAVRSLAHQYNKQYGEKIKEFDYEFKLERLSAPDTGDSAKTEELKNRLTEKLKENIPPPDEIEIMVFECWMDEMTKPREIAAFWELDIEKVRKAIKRLKRKLAPIKELLNSNNDE